MVWMAAVKADIARAGYVACDQVSRCGEWSEKERRICCLERYTAVVEVLAKGVCDLRSSPTNVAARKPAKK
jgi:hypothetical protein